MEETPSKSYEVFLSFRGVDTRDNFTSHLYKALCDRNVETFKDDPDLRRGDEISEALFKAIEESHISVVVFSKRYAFSRWCLEELVKILQCKDKLGQIVIPVFYKVNPSDVRNQTESYAEAFAEFEASKKHLDKIHTWKVALKEAANLSGFDSLVIKPESELIVQIVQEVSKRLSMVCSHHSKGLIGIDSRIDEIEAILGLEEGVRSVGIWGVGGIGKTTLANAVFNKIFYNFEGCCFLRNVRERFGKDGGLDGLQREFYEKISGGKCISNGGYAFEKRTLQGKKLLIVFDDVTDCEQIEDLISIESLDPRSRVIVTSRDSQVLNNCRVDQVYKVEVLSQDDAFKLFCQHALRENKSMSAYEELSCKFVDRLGCLPLALKVIGSSLLNRGKEFWEGSLRKLEKILPKNIHEVLKISYDELEDDQQNIFLDIVYFLNGIHKDQAYKYLSYYEFVEVEIEVLIDKSLIAVSGDNEIIIHDLLQDMGRMIERKQPIRTRLSGPEDIRHFLTKGQVSNAIHGISLDMSQTKDIYMSPAAFANIPYIRFLEFYCSKGRNENKVHIS